jgi:hypothetical protein
VVVLGDMEGSFGESRVELGGVGACLLMQAGVDVLLEEM